MACHPTTPAERLTRLLQEGANFVSFKRGDAGVDVTHDVVGLLESLNNLDLRDRDREKPLQAADLLRPRRDSVSAE